MKKLIKKINQSDHPMMQIVKYGIVGVANTLVTLIAIIICKSVIGIDEYVSNAIGYALGILNSFILNRNWVFHSTGGLSRDGILFLAGCGICYLVQFLIVYLLNTHTFLADFEYTRFGLTISGYGVATLIGMVAYTVCNFIYNRTIAFRKS